MIKEFNNTLHIKLDKEEIEEVKKNNYNEIETLCYLYNFSPISDEYCISNFDMAIDFEYNGGYNYYSISFNDLHKLKKGKMIIIRKLPKRYIKEYILK